MSFLSWCTPGRLAAVILAAVLGLSSPASAQNFAQPTVLLTGNWPAAVYTADLRGNGKTDLVALDHGATATAATAHIFYGNGAGGFIAGPTLPVAGTALAIGDLTGTGHDQIIWLTANANTVDIHISSANSDGTFAPPVELMLNVPGSPQNPVQMGYATVASLGAAGPRLLAEDTANNTLLSFQVTVTQSHATPRTSGSAALAGSLPAGAGALTLFAAHGGVTPTHVAITSAAQHTVQVFALAASNQQPATIAGVASALFADFDNDGTPDLIAEATDGSIAIFHGLGNGTFATTALSATGLSFPLGGYGGTLIAAADLNGDGKLDLLTATPAGISVLLNDGARHFTLGGVYNAGPGRSSFAVASLHGLGVPDLAVDSPEGVAVLFNNGSGVFQTSRSFPTGQPSYDLQLGKFSASGQIDAVVATGVPQIQWLAGDGQGNFTLNTVATPSTSPQTNPQRTLWPHLVQGDFDNDGKLDVAITLDGRYAPSTGDGLTVHFGAGDGTFAAPVQQAYTAGSSHFGFSAIGDFNGDGVPDIANLDTAFYAAYLGGSASRTGIMPRSVMYNDTADDNAFGGPTFLDLDAFDMVATGFLNPGRSTKQDVVFQDDNRILVLKNNGDATFTLVNTLDAATPFSAAPGNTGGLPNAGFFPGAMLFTDLDGDGFGDVVIAFHNLAADIANPSAAAQNQIWIYWGQGDGSFSTPTVLTPTRNFYELATADIAGTGRQDLVMSDGYMVGIERNLGARTFGPEAHYLAGMGINIVRSADVNNDAAVDLVVANGGPVYANPAANKGTLAAADLVNTGAVTVLLNSVLSHAVTGSVSASPEPSQYGQTFTLTATVAPPAAGAAPTGTVQFSIDGTAVGIGTLTGGAATYTVTAPTLIKGAHTLSAAYSGDTNYSAATFTGSHTITGLRSATTFTNTTPVIYYGQTADGNGTVAAVDVAAGADLYSPPSGPTQPTITFYDGATPICVLPLLQTPGTCPASAGTGFTAGTHILTAVYSGNIYYDGSTSPNTTTQVLPDNTTGALASSLNPSTFGQAVTFTATFTAPYATPTGTVNFYDGATQIGQSTLNPSGSAALLISTLAVGSHNITATLLASTNFNSSTTPIVVQVVNPAAATPLPTTILLSSSANPSTVGQSVTFTAAVMTTGGTILIPTGSVTFTIDGFTASTPALNNAGTAQFATSTLTQGTHTVVVTYAGATSGSTTFAASTSATLMQVVNAAAAPGTFTLTVTPAAPSVPIGSAIVGTATVTEPAGMNETVDLACDGLPAEASCTFGTPTLPAGGGVTTITIAVTAPHDCDANTPYFIGHAGTGTWLGALASLSLLWLARRRRRLFQSLALLLALVAAPALTGCGSHCTDLGVRPGTYAFHVTATAHSASATQTLQMLAHI